MPLPWEGEGQERRRVTCFSVAMVEGGSEPFPEGTWPGNPYFADAAAPAGEAGPAETRRGPNGYRQWECTSVIQGEIHFVLLLVAYPLG